MPPEKERATATGDLHRKKIEKIGPAVPEICSWTDRHTDRQTGRNTPLPYRSGVIIRLQSRSRSSISAFRDGAEDNCITRRRLSANLTILTVRVSKQSARVTTKNVKTVFQTANTCYITGLMCGLINLTCSARDVKISVLPCRHRSPASSRRISLFSRCRMPASCTTKNKERAVAV